MEPRTPSSKEGCRYTLVRFCSWLWTDEAPTPPGYETDLQGSGKAVGPLLYFACG